MTLTDAKVRALKAKAASYKVSDAEGLHVLVPPSGSKLWRLSAYPMVAIADASLRQGKAILTADID